MLAKHSLLVWALQYIAHLCIVLLSPRTQIEPKQSKLLITQACLLILYLKLYFPAKLLSVAIYIAMRKDLLSLHYFQNITLSYIAQMLAACFAFESSIAIPLKTVLNKQCNAISDVTFHLNRTNLSSASRRCPLSFNIQSIRTGT